MKRPKLTRLELLLFATPLFSLLAWLLMNANATAPLSWRYRFLDQAGQKRSDSCQNNLKQLGIGLLTYIDDFDEKLPLVKSGRALSYVGWVDEIYPYIKSTSLYTCPTANRRNAGTPSGTSVTDYWYNGNLSVVTYTKLTRTKATLMLGDGNDGKETINSAYSKTALPPVWLTDFSAPSYQHLGGANYLFADGHVAWLQPIAISTAPGAQYTFSLR